MLRLLRMISECRRGALAVFCVSGTAPLVLASCTEGSEGRDGIATVDTTAAGVIVVANKGVPARGDDAWDVVEELRIGALDGSEVEAFGDIAFLEVDGDGRIYVLDWMAQEVRVFEPDGTFSHRIGRRGQGPGEFEGAAGLAWSAAGELVVWDPRLGGYQAFEPDGTFVRSITRPVVGVGYPWMGFVDTAGVLYDWGLDRSGIAAGTPGDTITWTLVALRDTTPAFDTVATFTELSPLVDGRARIPFGSRTTRTADPRGWIWLSDVREVAIAQTTLGGDTVRLVTHPATGPPVTAHVRDSLVAGMREYGIDIDASDIPGTREVLTRIAVADDGSVWIFPELESGPAGSEAMIFGSDGVYQGRLSLPFGIELATRPILRNGRIWAEVTDELGVAYVVRARVEDLGLLDSLPNG